MLSDIRDYLQAQGIGTQAVDLFIGYMPDEPDSVVTLYEYAGSPPDLHWDGEYPGLQVRTAASNYDEGRAKIEQIKNLLHGLHETVLGSTRYLLIKASGNPEVLKRDENNRIVFFVNFEIIKERD